MTKSLPTTSFGFPTAALNFLKVKDSLWSMVPTAHVVPNGLFVLSADKTNSPLGTTWAVGTIDQRESLTFKKFRAAVGKPKDVVGKDLVMYLEDHDVYLSVKFTSWTEGKNGGFVYERSAN